MFIDSHAHIDGPEFDADRAAVLARARAAGVELILTVGTGDPHSGALERAVSLAEGNDQVLAAVGTHPHDARLYDDDAEQRIEALIRGSARVVAWGEIGLDYHYDHSPREVQRTVFARQLERAREVGVPAIVHTRAAEDDTIAILREIWSGASRPGIMHCFTGSAALAEATLAMGFLISFAGIITFKKAEELRAVACQVPLDSLLVETDCPLLAPVPHRGRRNEPAFVAEIARYVAQLRGTTEEELAQRIEANFARVFPGVVGAATPLLDRSST
jgi:TatD DNase family protein